MASPLSDETASNSALSGPNPPRSEVAEARGGDFISGLDPRFPPSLRAIARPPAGLWSVGKLPNENLRALSVVGSRAASGGGCQAAWALGRDLAQRSFDVVSGGAFGIDASAHEGALRAGPPCGAGVGRTFAVLGCGADIVYPDRHADLFARIVDAGGGLISEYAPGTPPRRGQFPARNRLIVGLSIAVIVVEAAPNSGALVTARLAREVGRLLLAVPGSAGTDALIGRGLATAVADAGDVEKALAGSETSVLRAHREAMLALSADEQALMQSIAGGRTDAAAVALALGVSIGVALARLLDAEMNGWIRRVPGGSYEVTFAR